MKRIVSIMLILVLILCFNFDCFADLEQKLENHWAYDEIDENFVQKHFWYLAKNNYKQFNPNQYITKQQFIYSLNSILKNPILDNKENNDYLTRQEMAYIIGMKFKEQGKFNVENLEECFKDIKKLPLDKRNFIIFLYQKNIIKGKTKDIFSPDDKVTQVEAIIILQRMKEVLDYMDSIPFKVIGCSQTASRQNEGVFIKEESDDKLVIKVVKKFSSTGCSMKIRKIVKDEDGKFKIFVSFTRPKGDYLTVITYKTLVVEIDKSYLGDAPYSFKMETCFPIQINPNSRFHLK